MKIDTYTNLEALMSEELDDAVADSAEYLRMTRLDEAVIPASTHDLGVDLTDPPFALPAVDPIQHLQPGHKA